MVKAVFIYDYLKITKIRDVPKLLPKLHQTHATTPRVRNGTRHVYGLQPPLEVGVRPGMVPNGTDRPVEQHTFYRAADISRDVGAVRGYILYQKRAHTACASG